jgi:ABC-2 type transport system ATP-binding protein
MIELRGLTRKFGDERAVDALDLAVERGELFGLVGPDGAGKTTTLRLLAGVLKISGGEARLDGVDLAAQPEAIKHRIGYMAQRFSLYGELTVLENLHFFADLFDVPSAELGDRSARLLRFAGLAQFAGRHAAHLSGGMQKKLALACTLIHEPEILLLDEPTTGVDPVSRREFWEILNELHLDGTTILVSTPYMDEADRCSRVGFLYQGRLLACAPPRVIRAAVGAQVIELQAAQGEWVAGVVQALPFVREVQTYGAALHLLVDHAEGRLKELERALRKAGVDVQRLRPAPLRMEEAFITMLRRAEHPEESSA